MRRLVLLRHAKADPRHRGDKGDHQRGLAGRGPDDARRMGRYLLAENIHPDGALVSDALRTQETFTLASAAFPHSIPIRLEPQLYGGEPSVLLGFVQASDDAAATLLLVGHNPEIAQLASELSGGGDPAALARLRSKFPTAAVAIIDFDVAHWADIRSGGGQLDRFVTPGMIGADGDE